MSGSRTEQVAEVFANDRLFVDQDWHLTIAPGTGRYWVARVPLEYSVVENSDGSLKIRTRIDVVADVEDASLAAALCLELNKTVVGSAFAYDDHARTMSIIGSAALSSSHVKSAIGPQRLPYLEELSVKLLAIATIESASLADKLAEPLAKVVGGSPNFSYPEHQSGLRETPDPQSEVVDIIRSRPEFVFDAFAYMHTPDVQDIANAHLNMLHNLGYSAEFNDGLDELGEYAIHVESASGFASEQLYSSVDHARLGAGIQFSQLLAVPSETSYAEFANQLTWDLWNDETSSVFGGFTAISPNFVMFLQVTPFAYLRRIESSTWPGYDDWLYAYLASLPLGLGGHETEYVRADVVDNVADIFERAKSEYLFLEHSLIEAGLATLEDVESFGELNLDHPHRELLDLSPVARLATFGTFNPMGPTVTSIELLERDGIDGYALAVMSRHPFLPAFTVIDHANTDLTGIDEVLATALAQALPSLVDYIDLSQCPDALVDVTSLAIKKRISQFVDEQSVDLSQRIDHVSRYLTDPWGAVSNPSELNSADEPVQPTDQAAIDTFFDLATEIDHNIAHWQHVPDAWDGSINYQMSVVGALPSAWPNFVWRYNTKVGVVSDSN